MDYDKLYRGFRVALEAEHPEYVQADSPTHLCGEVCSDGFENINMSIRFIVVGCFSREELGAFDQRVKAEFLTPDYIRNPKLMVSLLQPMWMAFQERHVVMVLSVRTSMLKRISYTFKLDQPPLPFVGRYLPRAEFDHQHPASENGEAEFANPRTCRTLRQLGY